VHGHAEQKVALRLLVQRGAPRVLCQESGGFNRVKAGNAVGGKACGAHDGGRRKTLWKTADAQYRQACGGMASPEMAPRAVGEVVLSFMKNCRYGSDRLQGFIGVD
jgi:hypothetical protein